jgi:hypothetical protein
MVVICIDDILAVLRATDLRFWLPVVSWAHTQNFEILKSLEQTQESKKFIISFEINMKMQDGLNFGKRCLLRCSIWIFFQNWKILIFFKKIQKFT